MKKTKNTDILEKRLEEVDEKLFALLAERIKISEKIHGFYWNKEDRKQYEVRAQKNKKRIKQLVKKNKIKETYPIVYSLILFFSRDHTKDYAIQYGE